MVLYPNRFNFIISLVWLLFMVWFGGAQAASLGVTPRPIGLTQECFGFANELVSKEEILDEASLASYAHLLHLFIKLLLLDKLLLYTLERFGWLFWLSTRPLDHPLIVEYITVQHSEDTFFDTHLCTTERILTHLAICSKVFLLRIKVSRIVAFWMHHVLGHPRRCPAPIDLDFLRKCVWTKTVPLAMYNGSFDLLQVRTNLWLIARPELEDWLLGAFSVMWQFRFILQSSRLCKVTGVGGALLVGTHVTWSDTRHVMCWLYSNIHI